MNLNYLIDPRAVAFGWEYNALYDAQMEGPAINRADGMVIEGVAPVVFNPNKQPVPKDSAPWWKPLVDFYRNDDDEE